MQRFTVLFTLTCLHACMSYDEIETQLHRVWKHSAPPAQLDTDNACLLKSFKFDNEKAEDAFLHDFVTNIPGGYGSGVSLPRLKATAILAKAALVLPVMGDFAETGLNAGSSACILMRMLMQYDNCNRKFWGYDSFAGLPNTTSEDGVWGIAGKAGDMSAAQSFFEGNLKRWGAWDEGKMVITKGYFSDTLPTSKVDKISFLRLDGDIFVSTWDALEHLYHKVVPGGYIYVDDYGSFEGCREAVDKFRSKHMIWEPLHFIREENQIKYIMFEAVWWKKRDRAS